MSKFFEAVFFDMDGLLVDSEPLWFESEKEITKPFDYDWNEEDQIACLGGPLSKVGAYMAQKCHNRETSEYFITNLIQVQAQRMRNSTPTMPGALDLLRSLQDNGIKTGLVSASPRVIVDAVLENLGDDLFPFSISSDDVENTKPHPDAYLKAAHICKAEVRNCLVFEDSLTGFKAAVSSGAFLIAVPHLVSVDEGARVRVVNSLEQIDYEKLAKLYLDFSAPL